MRELNIAYGNNCMAKKWSNKTIEWSELGNMLEGIIKTSESAEGYAKIKRGGRDAAKDKDGFVGGLLREGRQKRGMVISWHMLTMDADDATPAFLDADSLLSPYVTYIWRGSSGGHVQ